MSFTDAAYQVLRSAKRPLHAADIVERAMHEGLLQTSGKTPKATLAASLYLENARRIKREVTARFICHGHNVWGLTEWQTMQSPVRMFISDHLLCGSVARPLWIGWPCISIVFGR